MGTTAQLSVRTKLVLMLLAVGMGVDVVVGAIAFRNGGRALEERSFAHLTSIRTAKAAEIVRYVDTIRADVQTVAESALVQTAVDELVPAYEALGAEAVAAGEWADRPVDDTAYGAVHARIQPGLHAVVERFGYHDLFVIDAPSGAIVYSAAKEPDFATSLIDGPYANSHLARAFERARAASGDEVVLEDFSEYAPSQGAPAAFAATPIRRAGQVVAVLAVQLPVRRIEDIMTGGRQWERDGLGRTGETYLVGADGRMRSNSRFLVEDPSGLRARLLTFGVPVEEIDGVEQFGTTILQLHVDSEATRAAQRGEAGTGVIEDYRGVPVLSSWAPLDIDSVQWSIVSEMDLAEAGAPVRELFRRLTVAAVALFVPIFLASIALSAQFVKPVLALVTATRGAGSGRVDLAVQVMSEDEFGELSDTFNTMVASLSDKDRAIEAHSVEKGRLLRVIRSIFGRHVSEEVAAGLLSSPGVVAPGNDERQVTVLVSGLRDYAAIAEHLGPKQTLSMLSAYFRAMNEVVERHGGVVFEYVGGYLLAVFGAPNDLPGHAEQATRCAIDLRARLAQLNVEWAADGTAARWPRGVAAIMSHAGLDCGQVAVGHVGTAPHVKFAVVGDAVNVAARLEAANQELDTSLLVSGDVVERLPEQLRVKAIDHGALPMKGRAGTVKAFSLPL